jgi:TPR repeat protein
MKRNLFLSISMLVLLVTCCSRPTQSKGMDQRTGDAMAATPPSGTSAQSASPEQLPSEATQAKSTVGGRGTDAGALEDGLAAEDRGDWKAAFLLLKPLAEQGNPRAQANLGYMYDNGEGVPKDNTEAMKWYRKAADQFRKAADEGNADGQYHLGVMYDYGQGVPKDYAEAAKWFRKAADQGDADAQNALGYMYANGQGVPQNYTYAMNWFRAAADQGNADGQNGVGALYNNGQGVPQDYAQALMWYRKAADQGNADAQTSLGYMYDNGEGVPKDNTEAMKWYRKAADQGNADAQKNVTRLNEQDKIMKSKLEAKKEIGDTVCYPSSWFIYGQVENVHNDKIEVRVHRRDHDELEWVKMGIHLTQVTTIGSVATHGRNGGRLSPDSCGTRISV